MNDTTQTKPTPASAVAGYAYGTFTLRPSLSNRGHSAEDVEKRIGAWVKSCLLQVTLSRHPFIKQGDF